MNKRSLKLIISIILVLSYVHLKAQTKVKGFNKDQGEPSTSQLTNESKFLDQKLLELNKKIEDVINKYKLLSLKKIQILPYRIKYRLGEDYIEIDTYKFNRDVLVDNRITGIQQKRIRIYMSGSILSKIESKITEKTYDIESVVTVNIIDPSPVVLGSDDVIFDFITGKLKFIEKKKMGDIRNNQEQPIKNSIKRDFLLPHYTFCYKTILNIGETYFKSIKNVDKAMSDFLLKSQEY
ncbi:MAG: hypothetical protein SVR08_11730 [Spirochaetota bacterium]|nr:hypothetical protein [Spirochaetota bacterium]